MSRPATPSKAPARDGLRARHKRDKRDRLRVAAWELFTEAGYDATTTRAIAERAGVATGTLFLYAKDKPDLLFLVFEERLESAVEDAFRTLPAGLGLHAALIHIFRRLFAMYEESRALGKQFVKELPGADGPNAERVNALTLTFFQKLAALVEQAQERGEVRPDVAPLLAAHTFFAIYLMALLTWVSGFNTLADALESTLDSALHLLMRGLMDRPPAAP